MKKKELNYKLVDLQNQLKALIKCEDEVMQCGLIYPAIKFIQEAQRNVIEAMKCEALSDYGLEEEIEAAFRNSSVNHQWNWLDDFNKWREEKGGVIVHGRK
jgi:hypothetical protein